MSTIKHILKITFFCFILINAGIMLQAEVIDPKCGVADPDGKTVWYDCKLLAVEGKGWTNTVSFYDRLPANAKIKVPTAVWDLSHNTAGICIHFTTDAESIQVRWTILHSPPSIGAAYYSDSKNKLAMPHMPATGVSGIDLYGRNKEGKWQFLGNGRPREVSNSASFHPRMENILYLPLYNGVKSIEIGLPKNKKISIPKPSHREQRKPIVFYGTSITQGACASRPGMAATAIVGRVLDIPVINLGFSGSGKMEPEMADMLGELNPSIYVIDCRPNMNANMVSERLEPFVKKLRAARPTTPILLVGMVIDELTKGGIKNLYFLPREGMLGNDNEGTVDGGHPSDLGMMRQADVFIKALIPLLPASEPQRSNNTSDGIRQPADGSPKPSR